MALGSLMILFVAMSVISAAGLMGMFLVKNSRLRSGAVYGMAAWGLVIAYLGASSLPMNDLAGQAEHWVIGAVGAVGALLYWIARSEGWRVTGKVLTAAAVIVGIAELFFLI